MGLARVFLESDMRCGFRGLLLSAHKAGWKPEEKPEGTMTLFINRTQTKFKLLIGTHYLVYYANKSRRIPLEAVQHFPQFFDGKSIDVPKAIEKVIMRARGRIQRT